MKKAVKVLVLALLLCTLILIVYACTPHIEEEPKEATVQISSVEDFNRMRDMLGYKYSKTTFELTTDIDLSTQNWLVPIGRGASPEESFMGFVDGQGHTITYRIDIPLSDANVSDQPIHEKAYGLFGFVHNAKFKNLNINTNINIPTDAENMTVGALCAVINGGAEISNVKTTGDLITKMPEYEKGVGQEEVYNSERNSLIAGGVVGYIKGNFNADNVSSDIKIQVNTQGVKGERKDFLLDNLIVGGVIGMARTEDISIHNKVVNTAINLSFAGEIKAVGSKVLTGGIFGVVHYTDISKVNIELENSFEMEAFKRIGFGGVTGLLENSKLEVSSVKLGTADFYEVSAGGDVSFELGGAVGKAKNSAIDYVYAESELYIGDTTYFYAGGIAGVCMDSKIYNAAAKGGLILTDIYDNENSILDKNIKYNKSVQADRIQIAQNTKNGGIAGEISGQSVLGGKIASEFKAFYPIVANATKRLEIITLKKGEDVLRAWIRDSKFDEELMEIEFTDSNDAKDDEQQYTINHVPFVKEDATIFYRNENAKVVIDKNKWEEHNQEFIVDVCTNICAEGKYAECVTVVLDTEEFEGLQAEIMDKFN